MSTRNQQVCAYAGFGLIVLFFSGFTLAGFITPPDPQASSQQIAKMFDDDRTAIRVGLLISMFSAPLLVPWGAALFVQLPRADGRHSPMPYVMLLCMTLFSLEFIYLIMFWQVAAFRENWSPE